ncbi:MAG TPA: glycine cleavage system aminomethyltransferase GcvT [Phycisphaerae bacterium]|nr:glycine cleavage system aminomethyltransferase GcvT [Phycisphaerae bacterium]
MPETPDLLTTALHDRHIAMGAKMAPESGWEMPLKYRGVLDEVREVRSRAGVSDVSHLGRIRIRGGGAVDLLERLCTADPVHQEDHTALFTLLCNPRGGILDAAFCLRLENMWVLTTNACNREKVLDHLRAHAAGLDVKVDDQTPMTAMLSVSGPRAPELLDAVLPIRVAHTPRGWVHMGSLLIARYIAMRTGATGEWSLDVMLTKMMAGQAWRFITDKAGDNAVAPVGTAARDVLRIEAGLPRYGHEINETIDPITAGLERAVDFEHDFLGRDALLEIKRRGTARRLVGLAGAADSAEPPAIPRQGSRVLADDGAEVGAVTSGTFSPALDRPVAMGYVSAAAAQPGTALRVETSAGPQPFHVAELPLHRRT